MAEKKIEKAAVQFEQNVANELSEEELLGISGGFNARPKLPTYYHKQSMNPNDPDCTAIRNNLGFNSGL